MQAFLIGLHGGIRWLVVVVGLIATIKFLIGWLANSAYKGVDKGLRTAFIAVMDLNLLLGIILLVIGFFNELPGEVLRIRLEHALVMILAAGSAHLTSRWKEAADKIRFRQFALFFLLSMVLVYVGVATVNGWPWG